VVSSSLVLTLDTTAPQVTWGTPTGQTPGETLQIPYTTDEPLARAVLHLATGNVELTVTPTALTVLLAVDAPGGPADVTVYDDVGNLARSPSVVTISGDVQPPIRILGGTAPRRKAKAKRPAKPKPRTVSYESAITARTVWEIDRTFLETPDANHWDSETKIRAVVAAASAPAMRSTPRERVRVSVQTSFTVAYRDAISSRRDGPEIETLLLLFLVDDD
jgi:hypothetical protein